MESKAVVHRRDLLRAGAGAATLLIGGALGAVTASPAQARPGVPVPYEPGGRLLPPLRPGSSGADVVELQKRLAKLGYWCGSANGEYGHLTSQAVMALQKVAGLGRDGIAGKKTMLALQRKPRPKPRSSSGHVCEIDKSRQILMVVNSGKVSLIFNTSTGSGEKYVDQGKTYVATTPTGSYRFERQINGWRTSRLGRLYMPKYFVGGYAVHGSLSIPGYPASHGCCRVSLAGMERLWRSDGLPLGTRIILYS